MWSKSYYSNTYLGSCGEGSHAANLSGLLLDLFLRSRGLVVEQFRSSWKKPSQPWGAAFLLQIPQWEAWRWHLQMVIAPLEPGHRVQWELWLVVPTTALVPKFWRDSDMKLMVLAAPYPAPWRSHISAQSSREEKKKNRRKE